MAEPKVETFILFNEREDAVKDIVEALEAKGISTYFWRRDIEPGEKWDRVEAQKLREADTVLVFLGSAGWGPHHLPLTQEALDLDKRVIPVLIGDPPQDSFDKAEGLFRNRRYIEVREPSPTSIDQVVQAIRRREIPRSGRVENLLRTLIDGNEGERLDAFGQIKRQNSLDLRVLAARLREEITTNYAPSTVTKEGRARRPTPFVSSIRSWLISSLIYADGSSDESRELLLKHVQAGYEPERDVRFWTLAGLHNSHVPYAPEALKIGLEDNEAVVSWLARAAASPTDSHVIGTFRGWIGSGDFDVAWPALRVLRVIPLPELATDVCESLNAHEPGTPFSYDALYALASPEMARAAAPCITKQHGVEALVRRVISEAGGSNSNAPRNFALLLAALEEAAVDRALEASLIDPQNRDIAQRLRRHLAELRHRDGAAALRYVAGFVPDTIDVSDDRLGISEDVQTLTAIMMAKEVKPPVAIGLFGDWGSGKSFFMRSMRAAAEKLAAGAKSSSVFCSNIVSIEFNAWHYVDTNLWASLVSYILERLDEYVRGDVGEEARESVLVKELSSAKAVLKEAENEKARTEELVNVRKQELERLRLEREQKEVKLSELRAHDLYSILPEEQKKELKNALEEVGLPAALEGVSDLSSVIAEAHTVRGRANALFVALLKGRNRLIVYGLMAFVLVVVPLSAYYLRSYLNSFLLIASGIVAEFVAVAASVTHVLRKALVKANVGLRAVDMARESAERVLAEKRREITSEEQELHKEIVSLDAREKEATAKLSAAAARVQELEERIRSISEGRSLARFLAERTSSEDYRKHLGLISTVRRDFELLGTRLAAGQDGPGNSLRRVDRIILYIDDLDRCPSDKVLDVLQAVHLLLAYPLFVVVVGVDPRWLLHSLGKQYSAFQAEGGHFSFDPDIWRTTPQNYLEKIFQVPFTLRRMSSPGYSRLIEKLFSPTVKPQELEPHSVTDTQRVDVHNQGAKSVEIVQPLQVPRKPDEHPSRGNELEPEPEGIQGENEVKLRPWAHEFSVSDESLTIRSWEVSFAERLFKLIPTPRSAKRFSNTYRILKASVRADRLPPFEGTAEVPGDFQIPMLLLAILIGAPTEAFELFPILLGRASQDDDVLEVLRHFKIAGLASPTLLALEEKIRPVVIDEGFPNNAEQFLEWIPRVSRFSFDIGRAIQVSTSD